MTYGPQSTFALEIMKHKYSHTKADGTKETWEEIAQRVTDSVLSVVTISDELKQKVFEIIRDRKFIPGGRYLYAAGRPYHQVQNCLLMRAEDSREGWSELMHKASMALMSGAGIGVDYSSIRPEGSLISRTGGTATGPLALAQMVNEAGRFIMQGGSRRSAIWAGLNWKHQDIHKFISVKDWSPEVRALKLKDFNFPATLDGTNVSVILDKPFFDAYQEASNPDHSHAQAVYWSTVKQMLKKSEPGFSVDYDNSRESLRNACVIGETEILTESGYKPIVTLVGCPTRIWNGFEWSDVTPKITGINEHVVTITFSDGRQLTCTDYHKFRIAINYKGDSQIVEAKDLESGMKLIKHAFPVIETGEDYKYAYTQGFISAEGMDGYNWVQVYEPKFMCIPRLAGKVGGNQSHKKSVKFNHEPLLKSFVPFEWNLKSKLEWLSGLFDGDGTELKEGGLQLASVNREFLMNVQKLISTLGVQSKVVLGNLAGLRSMPNGYGGYKDYSCQTTYRICVGAVQMRELRYLGLDCSRMSFNKHPQRDASQFITVVDVADAGIADTVYCFNEPKRHLGIFNGVVTGQCTEITSEDDSDICNIGSLNLAQISTVGDFEACVSLSTLFLLAGTIYSDIPYAKVDEIRTKNRRLGLGLMGLHEWLLKRNLPYSECSDLASWLQVYQDTSNETAKHYSSEWGISCPLKTRASAPTGTIGIIGETTTGIEPIFCVAYKRRYLKGNTWHYQYVLDPTAKRLIDQGVPPEQIEDAYTLAENVEKRVAFQYFVQKYIDHGISSTINLPSWGSELNNDQTVRPFGEMLLKYLPGLRGVTTYADGSRGGQPLNPVKYTTAVKHLDQVFVENTDICEISGKGGSCGS